MYRHFITISEGPLKKIEKPVNAFNLDYPNKLMRLTLGMETLKNVRIFY
jgi:hypothetical protein